MKKREKLLTFKEVHGSNDDFELFNDDKERIKYMNNAYKDMSISKAFAIYYNMEISPETKQNKLINTVSSIELGKVYLGTVKDLINKNITFNIPGVKEEIICKEDFSDCIPNISAYLLTHNNQLLFEVREKKDNKYIVSIVNGYYKSWYEETLKAIKYEMGVNVHIDALVQGGYLAHTEIYNINEVTGRNYTHSVFIPGSHIVLNIERDFEKWVGEDVMIVPQKFVDFRTNFKTGETEKSMVGSRKMVLQKFGNNNLENLYNTYLLAKRHNGEDYIGESLDGTVTGIINSNKKTGIFVELDGMYITGLMPIDSSDLLNYKPGDHIKVLIDQFEVQEGRDPFVHNKRGDIIKCNTRIIFRRA